MNTNTLTEREERDDPGEVVTADRLAVLQATVDHHARHVARVAPAISGDVEDVRQALFLEGWSASRKFEPARASWSRFMDLTVRGAAWDLAGRRLRQRRMIPRSLDADAPADGGSGSPSGDPADLNAGHDERYAAIEQAVDLERAVCTLPPDLRKLCRALRRLDPTVAQRQAGLSPAEFYRRRREIAMRLRSLGVSPG